jgi:hypothetical protein
VYVSEIIVRFINKEWALPERQRVMTRLSYPEDFERSLANLALKITIINGG